MQLEWLESALLELEGIVTHIADDKPQAAKKFQVALNKKVQSLAFFPTMGRESHQVADVVIRELVVHQNYVVFYRHDDQRVEIVAVNHVHRNWP